ncbi:MAG: TIGR00282 family metallophosphoesterase [Candidatus Doudnabacteria bacterium]|nr:TIGR00282 family metallophosphoesterase [Candidatus Doudnabacteria bacterium]
MKILFLGDIVGKPGRKAVATILPKLKAEYAPDLTIANAENLAHGKGVTLQTVGELHEAGVDFFTSGNHVFDKPEGANEVFEKYSDRIIRPANFVSETNLPGEGYKIFQARNGTPVLLINLNGQVFMETQFDLGKVGNPFIKLNEILAEAGEKAKIKILDFHAEATSEKRAMGFWADGRLSAVLGTHTHVATADAQVLRGGTGYLTDLGMVASAQSVIGVTAESALKRFLAGESLEKRFPLELADTGKFEAGYCIVEIDDATGKCQNIKGYLESF